MQEILRVQKLGKNHGSYHGETIDIRSVLLAVRDTARQHHWKIETFHEADGLPFLGLHRPAESGGSPAGAKFYISAGIHGDEPAGPLAALKLVQENQWPKDAEIFLVPCLNPVGFTLNRRENSDGLDLNRDYRQPKSAEARAHLAWLERLPEVNLYFCLHEDWESHGFYLYEQNPDRRRSLAETIIEAVKPVCPVDMSETIEGRAAKGGIIRPIFQPHERPDWPEAFYLITHKSRQGYTLEAPSDFPLPVRVNALVTAVRVAMGLRGTDADK